MKVLIAGGGIGGLTAALCCLHFGHDVTVFEQASELSEVGAGLQIPPNAMKVFEALSIDGLIAKSAFRPDAIEARMGVTGRHIFNIPLSRHAEDMWGSPYLHIHRADYIDALKRVLLTRAPNSLRLGDIFCDYRNHDGGVIARLGNGQDITGDILIGADGIKSTVRTAMLGPDEAQFTGNVAWRAVVPMDALGHAPKPTACVWMGRGRHAVTYQLQQGRLANFVGIVERDEDVGEGWKLRGSREDALSDFKGWHPTVTNLIKAAQSDSFYRWALHDRKPLVNWVDGQVALLGDAAHPMLPFLAQGAAMAVEDAWVLAREISQNNRSITQSLGAYQTLRHERTRKAQAGSRANMKTFHQSTATRQIATYGPMWLAGKLAPSIVRKRMDWLYGFDVTI